MSRFLIILSAVLFFSCSEQATEPVHDNDNYHLYPFLHNINSWELESNNSEMTIEIQPETDEYWALNFWYADSLIKLKTKILKVKYFKEKLPIREEYAISETDSGIFFGTNYPAIPPIYYKDTIFYKSFFLPYDAKDTVISEKKIIDYGSYVFTYLNKTFIKDTTFIFKDSLYKCLSVNHMREQTEFDETIKSGEVLIINYEKGFMSFRNYYLEKILRK